jgi:sulfur-oxidizing protein SoxA
MSFLAVVMPSRFRLRSHLRASAFICGSVCLHAVVAASAAQIPLAERRSGYEFMSRDTRAMQDDELTNPGLLWVLDGEALWSRRDGAGRSCADCHGEAGKSMTGVAARYPAWDAAVKRPVNLEQRINSCRAGRQQLPALAYESRELLALSAYVARQSCGLPIAVAEDERTQPFLDAGRATFNRRQGQLNLACTQCHDEQWGKKLAGNNIPQAHPTGYPLYRLEWQGLGSLQRRLRNCMTGMRAEPYAYGAPEFVDLELYLMWRARGMKVEAPAVRP